MRRRSRRAPIRLAPDERRRFMQADLSSTVTIVLLGSAGALSRPPSKVLDDPRLPPSALDSGSSSEVIRRRHAPAVVLVVEDRDRYGPQAGCGQRSWSLSASNAHRIAAIGIDDHPQPQRPADRRRGQGGLLPTLEGMLSRPPRPDFAHPCRRRSGSPRQSSTSRGSGSCRSRPMRRQWSPSHRGGGNIPNPGPNCAGRGRASPWVWPSSFHLPRGQRHQRRPGEIEYGPRPWPSGNLEDHLELLAAGPWPLQNQHASPDRAGCRAPHIRGDVADQRYRRRSARSAQAAGRRSLSRPAARRWCRSRAGL